METLQTSGFYPYTWWAQLAPSEKYGESFHKILDKKFPPIFLLSPFSICTFNKKLPLFLHFLYFSLGNLHP